MRDRSDVGSRIAAWVGDGGSARSAVDKGLDVVTSVRDTATEALRARRDPAQVALRRKTAARRRLLLWLLAALLSVGVAVNIVGDIVRGDGVASNAAVLVLVAGLFTYSVIGATSAGRDLRARSRVVRQLPPPQPARRPVVGPARPHIAQLDAYSDALRANVGMVGLPTGSAIQGTADGVLALRDDTLAAADAAELRIRGKAAELTALHRAGSAGSNAGMTQLRDRLESEIRSGVAEYGRLVAAASEAAIASAHLASASAGDGAMADVTDRLTALAAGMREVTITQPPR